MKKFKIKIDKCPYITDKEFFKSDTLQIDEGLNVLVGCNGYGKSTLLKSIQTSLDKMNSCNLNECISKDGKKIIKDIPNDCNNYYFKFDSQCKMQQKYEEENLSYEGFASKLLDSEGQQLVFRVGQIAYQIGLLQRAMHNYKVKNKNLFLLFDAIDSGISIDNIDQFKNLIQLILKNSTDHNVYIIVSANTYEMVCNENSVDAKTFEHIKFSIYEDYKEYILTTSRKE